MPFVSTSLPGLPEAVVAQERAIRLHLAQYAPSLLDVALVDLAEQPCADLIEFDEASDHVDESCSLQT